MWNIFNDLINTKQFSNVFKQASDMANKKWYNAYLTSDWKIGFQSKEITFDSLEKSKDHRTL